MPTITYISAHNGDVPKLVRGGSAKALFISSSLIVACTFFAKNLAPAKKNLKKMLVKA